MYRKEYALSQCQHQMRYNIYIYKLVYKIRIKNKYSRASPRVTIDNKYFSQLTFDTKLNI